MQKWILWLVILMLASVTGQQVVDVHNIISFVKKVPLDTREGFLCDKQIRETKKEKDKYNILFRVKFLL